jgi:hypothetical protein
MQASSDCVPLATIAPDEPQPKEADVRRSDHQPRRAPRADDRDRLVARLEQLDGAGESRGTHPVGVRHADGAGERRAGPDRADAGGADQEVDHRRLHRLPRGRQEAEDAEAAPDDRLRHDAGGVPRALGPEGDYPMVAPNYAKKRQELAKKIGLGRKPRVVEPEPAPAPRPAGRAPRPQPEVSGGPAGRRRAA